MKNLSLQFLNPLAPMRDLISGSKISIQSLFVARTLCHECTSSMLVGREFAFFFVPLIDINIGKQIHIFLKFRLWYFLSRDLP